MQFTSKNVVTFRVEDPLKLEKVMQKYNLDCTFFILDRKKIFSAILLFLLDTFVRKKHQGHVRRDTWENIH